MGVDGVGILDLDESHIRWKVAWHVGQSMVSMSLKSRHPQSGLQILQDGKKENL